MLLLHHMHSIIHQRIERQICNNMISGNSHDYFFLQQSIVLSSFLVVRETHPCLASMKKLLPWEGRSGQVQHELLTINFQ